MTADENSFFLTVVLTSFGSSRLCNPEVSGSESRDGAKISREKSGPVRFHP